MTRNLTRSLAAGVLLLLGWAGAQAQLSQQPLTIGRGVAPNVLFALSVEYPTADTAAYQSGTYVPATEYLGYFDPNKCYIYVYNSTTPANSYFEPAAAATAHVCSSKWSGNFMNWVSMTGLDAFRYAMTGGTRAIDTSTLTVLKRTSIDSQGGASLFPNKSITGATLVAGATPLDSSKTWTFRSHSLGTQMVVSSTAANATSDSGGSVIGDVDLLTGNGDRSRPYVQVRVCYAATGVTREANCTLYGTTIYKPEGTIQRNADKMRFGALSYYNNISIDNAVMRAKMKFTGQTTYSAAGVSSANAAQEWDPATGIYYDNPDAADAAATAGAAAGGVTNSGVVNYINKFGYNGQNYKAKDNVGKLYYEALRYLRYLAPSGSPTNPFTPAFYGGADATNNDNFPVITSAPDPILAVCQKNFIFVLGDVHTHCDKRLPGGSFTSDGGCTNPVSDKGSLTTSPTDPVSVTTWTNNISPGLATTTAGVGTASYYMAGLAFWAHTNDIRPDLNSPSGGPATGVKTTVTTYIVDVQEPGSNPIGIDTQFWKAAIYGGFDVPTGVSSGGGTVYPNFSTLSNWASYDPFYDGTTSNDGSTAAGHGIRPKNYLPAGNPAAMISAVNNAFASITAALGETAAVSQSSGDLRYSGGAYLYQGIFTSGTWVGDLRAYSVSVVTAGVSISATPTWSASTKLDAANPTPAARVVLTYNDGIASYSANTSESATLSRKGVAFSALADLSTAQQAALNSDAAGNTDTLGTNRVSYFRGSRTDESSVTPTPTGKFRSRTSLLGDIVNSTPTFVGAPDDVSFEPGYISFALAKASRTPVVYVGANDGMLHGFNAKPGDTNLGKEVLAYIPSPLTRKLSKLTASPYAHAYYADGTPVVADACPAAACVDATSWKTVLVSGLNAGGQGIFALDVTDPTNFTSPGTGAASNVVMWEFTDSADRDLGYTFGKPLIAKMNNGKWAAIFGNGYSNTTADGAASTTGAGALYIVFLSGPTGTNRTWTLGTDYIKLVAGNATTTPGTVAVPNGLGGPVGVDADLNGTLDYVYAADVYGNVWKFDVSSTVSASTWNTAFSGQPLFSAVDSGGTAQPITSGLAISFSAYGGFMLNFGTGSFIKDNDSLTTTTQTLYGILDRNNGTRIPTNYRSASVTNSLQKQSVIATGTVNGVAVSVNSDCLVNYPGLSLASTANGSGAAAAASCPNAITSSPPVQLGWYFDLPGSGQRMVAERPIVDRGTVDYVTLSPTGDSCTGGASGVEYIFNVNTGGRTAVSVFDLQGSGLLNSAQQVTTSGGATYVVSGRTLPASTAINTPGRFMLPPSTAGGGGGTVGGAGGASVGCGSGTFVAGWGCVGGTSGGIQRAAQCTGAASTECVGLFLPGQKNRLYWRQLFTQ